MKELPLFSHTYKGIKMYQVKVWRHYLTFPEPEGLDQTFHEAQMTTLSAVLAAEEME
jgi:hypothetical protein